MVLGTPQGAFLMALNNDRTSVITTRSPTAMAMATFPVQFHHLLTDLEARGQSHIASFQPHGRAFKVHRLDAFVRDVLPNWFRQRKYTSFQRQLNIYGFTRITAGPDKHAYYHEKFLRGHSELAQQIPRSVLKGTGSRQPTTLNGDPNFYAMEAIPPPANNSTGGAQGRETAAFPSNGNPPFPRNPVAPIDPTVGTTQQEARANGGLLVAAPSHFPSAPENYQARHFGLDSRHSVRESSGLGSDFLDALPSVSTTESSLPLLSALMARDQARSEASQTEAQLLERYKQQLVNADNERAWIQDLLLRQGTRQATTEHDLLQSLPRESLPHSHLPRYPTSQRSTLLDDVRYAAGTSDRSAGSTASTNMHAHLRFPTNPVYPSSHAPSVPFGATGRITNAFDKLLRIEDSERSDSAALAHWYSRLRYPANPSGTSNQPSLSIGAAGSQSNALLNELLHSIGTSEQSAQRAAFANGTSQLGLSASSDRLSHRAPLTIGTTGDRSNALLNELLHSAGMSGQSAGGTGWTNGNMGLSTTSNASRSSHRAPLTIGTTGDRSNALLNELLHGAGMSEQSVGGTGWTNGNMGLSTTSDASRSSHRAPLAIGTTGDRSNALLNELLHGAGTSERSVGGNGWTHGGMGLSTTSDASRSSHRAPLTIGTTGNRSNVLLNELWHGAGTSTRFTDSAGFTNGSMGLSTTSHVPRLPHRSPPTIGTTGDLSNALLNELLHGAGTSAGTSERTSDRARLTQLPSDSIRPSGATAALTHPSNDTTVLHDLLLYPASLAPPPPHTGADGNATGNAQLDAYLHTFRSP